ncbi:MAG: thermonuclease family protein [Azoarcus sp.]|jgi:endonuclease YncB( thermonuclease family)|nr:thermonuclease family protein [Azoarcus sp.]
MRCKKMKNMARAALLALLFAAAPASAASGRVIGAADGDTLRVLINGASVRVRLVCIDAPERRQAFGNRARQALSKLVFRQNVDLDVQGRDQYGRTLARVWLGRQDINAEMVRLGLAWMYRSQCKNEVLRELEAEAKAARRGLWVDPSPVPPWKYRWANRRSDGKSGR